MEENINNGNDLNFGGTQQTIGERSNDFDVLRIQPGSSIYVSIIAGAQTKYTHFFPVKYKNDKGELKDLNLPITCAGRGCGACGLARIEKDIIAATGGDKFDLKLKASQSYWYVVLDRTAEVEARKQGTELEDAVVAPMPMEINTTLHKQLQSVLKDNDAPWFNKPGEEVNYIFKLSKLAKPANKVDGYNKYDYSVTRLDGRRPITKEEIQAIKEFAVSGNYTSPNGNVNLMKYLEMQAKPADDTLAVLREGKYVFDINNSKLGAFKESIAEHLNLMSVPIDISLLQVSGNTSNTQALNPSDVIGDIEQPSISNAFNTSADDEELPFE